MCHSNKWTWLGAERVTPQQLEDFMLVRYRCDKCQREFLVEEAKGSRLVTGSVTSCVHCGSSRIEKASRPGADIELWVCKQCNGYMGRLPQSGGDDKRVSSGEGSDQ